MQISIFNNTFFLHHSGALHWHEQQMLFIADVHLGKVMHFRKAGIAIPPQAHLDNFRQLQDVVAYYKPKAVCFLGDLFHSELNSEWNFFCEWVSGVNTQVILVAGNHDILPVSEYLQVEIQYLPYLQIDKFLFTHHPERKPDLFNFCGHIHPCVRLQGIGKQFLRVPCFVKKHTQLVLPAFGSFTGMYEIDLEKSDQIFALGENEVLEVSIKRKGRS